MGTELENYNEYEKALARLIEYVEAFEKAWKFAPSRELENVFSEESSPEEQETIVAQLLADAKWIDEATPEDIRALDASVDWSEND